MAVNAVANAMAKGNAPVATKTEAASEATKGLTFTPEQRGELLRWAHGETGRMAEEAQFAEDGTPENPLSEADLVRYQEIQDAMKSRDYAALSAMRGEAEAQPNMSQSVPSKAGVERGNAASATVNAPVNAEVNTTSNSEGYEQQGAGPARTAPRQAKDSGRPRTKEELDRLGREVEEKMIAAGRDVEEAKAMGLLASEFAHRFAERTGTEAKDALNIEFRRGKAQEKRGAQGKGYAQTSARQSEEYDPGDPKTWPAGQARDEALALEAWQNLENDDEVETWPESPEKTRALGLQKESRQIDAWIENLSRAEKFLMDMVEVIANGDLGDEYGRRGGRPRIDITKGPITAVLGKARNGEKVTWVVTGWDERVPPLKKPRSDTPGKEQGLPGATLSETTPPVTEREQNKASTDSKPPVAQKDKGESTVPNGRTYFLPDGTSVIEFFETANKSTSFHEFGHHVLNKMMESSGLEGVDPQLVEDVKTILDGAGVSREAFDANMEYALRHYLNLSARYIAMDTLKHDGINLFEWAFGRFDNDHKGLARYTKDYINDVLGVPSNVEQTLNNWVRNSWLGKYLPNVIGDRPATVAANSIASLVVHCKLGFLNVASAAMNLSQLNGTQAIIGPIQTARALAEYLHPNQATLRLYADAGEGMRRRGAGGGESTAYERAMRGVRTPRRHEDYRSMQNYAGMWN